MEWYCRVDFTSPGQYMLVVAFTFKESESKEEDSVFGMVRQGVSVQLGDIDDDQNWGRGGTLVALLAGWMDGGKITRPLQYDRSEWLMYNKWNNRIKTDAVRKLMRQGVGTHCSNYDKWEREMISSIITSSERWIRRYKQCEKRGAAEVARKPRRPLGSKKWAKMNLEKMMQWNNHWEGLVMLVPTVETVRKTDFVWNRNGQIRKGSTGYK